MRARVPLACLLASLSACAGDAGPLGALDSEASELDLMNDFVPGDARFQRDPALNVDNISAHGEARSHTISKNCLACHQENGPGRGIFTIAGSLLDERGRPYPNAVLKLFDTAQAPGGGPVTWGGPVELTGLVMQVEVDANGNFFTTEPLPDSFPDKPLYPQFFSRDDRPLLRGDADQPALMGSGVQVGGCNFCHNAGFPITGRDASEEG